MAASTEEPGLVDKLPGPTFRISPSSPDPSPPSQQPSTPIRNLALEMMAVEENLYIWLLGS